MNWGDTMIFVFESALCIVQFCSICAVNSKQN